VIWALRSAFLLQALLGLGLARLLLGQAPAEPERNAHLGLGLIAAALAIVVLRPGEGDDGQVTAARFFPLLPVAVGLLFRTGALPGLWAVYLHIALGIVAVALIEMAITRRRRVARQASLGSLFD
jgi:hypothetical protein